MFQYQIQYYDAFAQRSANPNSPSSQLLIKRLRKPLSVPLLLRGDLIGVVSHDFADPAGHVLGELALDEAPVQAHPDHDHHRQRHDRHHQDDHHVAVGLVTHRLWLGHPGRAVLGRGGEAGADGVGEVCGTEGAAVDHVVDGDLGEAVEAELVLPGAPGGEGVEGVDVVDVVEAHLLQDGLGALVEVVPVAVAVLVEEVHVLEPLLRSALVEDSHLVQLLADDALPHVALAVLVVEAAVLVEVAVVLVARLATHRVVDRLEGDVRLQLPVLGLELAQEEVGAALGGGDEEGDCGGRLLGDWEVGNDFDCAQPRQFLEGVGGDVQAGDVHLLAVPVVRLNHAPRGEVGPGGRDDDPLGADGLRSERPLGVGAGLDVVGPDDEEGGLLEVFEAVGGAEGAGEDEQVEAEGLAVGDLSEVSVEVADGVVREVSHQRTRDHQPPHPRPHAHAHQEHHPQQHRNYYLIIWMNYHPYSHPSAKAISDSSLPSHSLSVN